MPEGQHDVWIRLEHMAFLQAFTFEGRAQMARFFYRSRLVQDEGDLLIAERSLPEVAEAELLVQKIRKDLVNKPAPELAVKEWFNSPADLSIERLRGNVVLLKFWGKS